MSLSTLNEIPSGVAAAGALIDQIDACFCAGFARLTPDQTDALASVARTFTGTPLGERLEGAVEALGSGQVVVEHLQTLAAARASLQGASHDALVAQATGALGLPAPAELESPPGPALEGAAANLSDSARHWLLEVALAGFYQLDRPTVSPFVAVLKEMQQLPELVRLSALLTGFATELLDHTPTAALDEVPRRRWVDIWTRAMLVASFPPARPVAEPVSGTFSPLGVDLRHHDNLVSAVVHGVLEPEEGPARLARATLSAWKVGVVTGKEIWGLFDHEAADLLSALDKSKKLALSNMPLSPTGDLVWSRDVKVAKGKAAPLDTAAAWLGPDAESPLAPAGALPLDRHPVQVSLPVYLQGASSKKTDAGAVVEFDGGQLPLALERLSPQGPSEADVLGSGSMFGLLRVDDGGWRLQPLTVEGKEGVGQEISKGLKARRTVASTLKERAGKLLRKKS